MGVVDQSAVLAGSVISVVAVVGSVRAQHVGFVCVAGVTDVSTALSAIDAEHRATGMTVV